MLLWPEALGHAGNCPQVSSPTSLRCPQRHHVTFRGDRLKTKWLSRAGRILSSYCTGFITNAAAFLMIFMPSQTVDYSVTQHAAGIWSLFIWFPQFSYWPLKWGFTVSVPCRCGCNSVSLILPKLRKCCFFVFSWMDGWILFICVWSSSVKFVCRKKCCKGFKFVLGQCIPEGRREYLDVY